MTNDIDPAQQFHEVIGTRVEVYFNLHKLVWSVREPHGKVLFHANKVSLKDVTWVVQQAGRKRVLEERKKNVHAFGRGYLTFQAVNASVHGMPYAVMYNPYKYVSFMRITPHVNEGVTPIIRSDLATFGLNVDGSRGIVRAV